MRWHEMSPEMHAIEQYCQIDRIVLVLKLSVIEAVVDSPSIKSSMLKNPMRMSARSSVVSRRQWNAWLSRTINEFNNNIELLSTRFQKRLTICAFIVFCILNENLMLLIYYGIAFNIGSHPIADVEHYLYLIKLQSTLINFFYNYMIPIFVISLDVKAFHLQCFALIKLLSTLLKY
jgi:hypothetical protein